ncbi:hypothetical protein BT63DRAFT_420897 [Microthyrium microscopicum]|uniref:Nuclear pore complex component n=1 Tax=Microthyrium microscopicum TaxID=703497 RepID=A0A6A6UK78_9PEZI|nr:hypothetical protein BT63DRAFT_420897 [Microthyrium microscopicum]
MASLTTTTTPSRPLAPPAAPTPPGSWQHPRLTEISQRRLANTFDQAKAYAALSSAAILIASFVLPNVWPFASIFDVLPSALTLPIWLVRLFVTYTGVMALGPLWRRPDDMSDIPLTPSQRALLGLGPASAPATPGTTYVTPPRYSRSTSRGASSSRMATGGSSPFGRSVSPSSGNGLRGSPSSGSPLVRKAVGKRASLGSSWGSSGGFGTSEATDFGGPASPSPNGPQRTVSVALNNKWLYKRRNASPMGMNGYI